MEQVASMLQTIKSYQYELTIEEEVETRTRTVTKWHWVTRYRTEIVNGVEVQVSLNSMMMKSKKTMTRNKYSLSGE